MRNCPGLCRILSCPPECRQPIFCWTVSYSVCHVQAQPGFGGQWEPWGLLPAFFAAHVRWLSSVPRISLWASPPDCA